MSIFHTLEFGGVNSLDNGIYITGQAVYNAPEREVETITIPGRNGAFALDKGRFENIEVTYPAGAFAHDQETFSTKMRRFRNLLASKPGYMRLVDDYNPDEYRLAVFKDAIEADPFNGRAGEFSLVFNCKPQRYLMNGDTAIDVTTGDELFNPTFFDASPLIEAEGYGDITFNGYTISIENGMMGNITLGGGAYKVSFNTGVLNPGDTISVLANFAAGAMPSSINVSSVLETTVDTNPSSGTPSINTLFSGSLDIEMAVKNVTCTFTAGTTATHTYTTVFKVKYVYSGVERISTITMKTKFAYSATNGTIDVSVSGFTITNDYESAGKDAIINKATAVSTVSLLGNPTYIDCDLGECYKIESGGVVSLDKYIDLGSELPTFAPGSNEITFDNTFTDIKIKPRWWIV